LPNRPKKIDLQSLWIFARKKRIGVTLQVQWLDEVYSILGLIPGMAVARLSH